MHYLGLIITKLHYGMQKDLAVMDMYFKQQKKEDVLAYFQYRHEDEFIIDFNKIYNLKAEKIMNIKI